MSQNKVNVDPHHTDEPKQGKYHPPHQTDEPKQGKYHPPIKLMSQNKVNINPIKLMNQNKVNINPQQTDEPKQGMVVTFTLFWLISLMGVDIYFLLTHEFDGG